jgi:hypothetical protein
MPTKNVSVRLSGGELYIDLDTDQLTHEVIEKVVEIVMGRVKVLIRNHREEIIRELLNNNVQISFVPR